MKMRHFWFLPVAIPVPSVIKQFSEKITLQNGIFLLRRVNFYWLKMFMLKMRVI
jgi:hypothetical protein